MGQKWGEKQYNATAVDPPPWVESLKRSQEEHAKKLREYEVALLGEQTREIPREIWIDTGDEADKYSPPKVTMFTVLPERSESPQGTLKVKRKRDKASGDERVRI